MAILTVDLVIPLRGAPLRWIGGTTALRWVECASSWVAP